MVIPRRMSMVMILLFIDLSCYCLGVNPSETVGRADFKRLCSIGDRSLEHIFCRGGIYPAPLKA